MKRVTKRCANCGALLQEYTEILYVISLTLVNEAFRCPECRFIGNPIVEEKFIEDSDQIRS